MRDLWIDFNDIDDGDEVETLLSFARPGFVATVGESVIVGDDDGLTCKATVIAVGPSRVRLRLDRGSLHTVPTSDAVTAVPHVAAG